MLGDSSSLPALIHPLMNDISELCLLLAEHLEFDPLRTLHHLRDSHVHGACDRLSRLIVLLISLQLNVTDGEAGPAVH